MRHRIEGKALSIACVIFLFTAIFCPLMGQNDLDEVTMYRGNLQRTGVFAEGGPMPFGEVVWIFDSADMMMGAPVVVDGVVYAGTALSTHTLHAIDFDSGEEKWGFDAGGAIRSSAAVNDGVVYFGTMAGGMYAVNVDTGEKKWKFQIDGGIVSSPAIVGKAIYFGGLDNTFYAVDIESGKPIWKVEAGGDIPSSPAIHGETIYFSSRDNKLYAVELRTGEIEWEFETDGLIHASPSVHDGIVIVGSRDNHLYAINAHDGKLIWKYDSGYEISVSAAIFEGKVFASNNGGRSDSAKVFALDLQSGEVHWETELEIDRPSRSPSISGNSIYWVGTHSLYVFNVHTGEAQWQLEAHPLIPVPEELQEYFVRTAFSSSAVITQDSILVCVIPGLLVKLR